MPAVEEAPSTPAVSQDDLKKRQMLEKMRKEELFSLKQEGWSAFMFHFFASDCSLLCGV